MDIERHECDSNEGCEGTGTYSVATMLFISIDVSKLGKMGVSRH